MIDRDDLKFFKNIIDLNNKDTKYKTLDDVVFSLRADDRYGFLYSILSATNNKLNFSLLENVINVIRKERGSSTFYGAIAFAALIISIGFVMYQFYSESIAPAAIFSADVLVDDSFGSFFAIAMSKLRNAKGSPAHVNIQGQPAFTCTP